MELVRILKSLWRRRLLVAAAAALALLAAIVVASRGETARGGTASAEILIDARKSALGDLRRETLPLVARSAIFARLLGADGATEAIAREAGIQPEELAVVGPQLRIDGVPDPVSAERAAERSEDASRLVQVQQGDDLPLLTIFTRAPSPAEAEELANGTADALNTYVTEYQERAEIPPERRVKIRQLGPARATAFEDPPSMVLPLLTFAILFGAACVGILAWPRVREAWRMPDENEPAPVRHLPERSANGRPAEAPASAIRRVLAAVGLAQPAGGSERPARRSQPRTARPKSRRTASAGARKPAPRKKPAKPVKDAGKPVKESVEPVKGTARPVSEPVKPVKGEEPDPTAPARR